MELYKALKTVVDLQGSEILKDQRLINVLSDFKAYEETPAAKFLLKSMISEGLMAKLMVDYSSSNDISTVIATNKTSLSDTYGFKDDIVDYVLLCISYAQGWIEEKPSFTSTTVESNTVNVQPPKTVSIVDDGKHLLFKQFPINGDVNEYIELLTSSGYTLDLPYNYTYNYASLRGSFAGDNDCTIAVVGTSQVTYSCKCNGILSASPNLVLY